MDTEEKLIAHLTVRIIQKQKEPSIESSVDGNTVDIVIALFELVAHLSGLRISEKLLLTAFLTGIEHSEKLLNDELMA